MKRHPFDAVSFVFGVLLLGLGLTGVFADEDISYLEPRWIWPGLFVIAGLGVVVFTIGRKGPDAEADGEVYDPVE